MDAIRAKLQHYGDAEAVLLRLTAYAELLRRRATEFSLIAPSTLETLETRHFLDSLYCLDALETLSHCAFADASASTSGINVSRENYTMSIIDVGSGAGFPGLVIAAVREDFSVTLLDSNAKKCRFLREAADVMGLKNVTVLNERAEVAAAQYRERFDAAVSRAVAGSALLCELCAAFVRVGGTILAMKSRAAEAEMNSAKKALKTLGFSPFVLSDYTLDGAALCIAATTKLSQTPPRYPRSFAQIKSKPL